MEYLKILCAMFLASVIAFAVVSVGEFTAKWLIKRIKRWKMKSAAEFYCWEHPEDCDCHSCEDWEWCHPFESEKRG